MMIYKTSVTCRCSDVETDQIKARNDADDDDGDGDVDVVYPKMKLSSNDHIIIPRSTLTAAARNCQLMISVVLTPS